MKHIIILLSSLFAFSAIGDSEVGQTSPTQATSSGTYLSEETDLSKTCTQNHGGLIIDSKWNSFLSTVDGKDLIPSKTKTTTPTQGNR